MKIAVVSPCFGVFGGMEAFAFTLGGFLANQNGCEVRLVFKLTQGGSPEEELISTFSDQVYPVLFARRASLQLVKQILWADIVHCQNPCPDVVLLAKLFGKKVVLTVHNRRSARRTVHSRLWDWCLRLADRCWFNSAFVQKTWAAAGIGRSEVIPTVSKLPTGIVPPEQRRGFVFAGRWIENKGVETLVRAYSAARINRHEWPLRLLGDGPLRPQIEKLLRDLRLVEVEMPGFVDEATKADAIRNARWLVAPPNTNEDLGLTPIEARSVGVPAIITNDGGLPEAAGDAALVCEPGETASLTLLLEQAASMSDEEYEQRAHRCRETLTDFLKPMSFYVDAYASVLDGQS